MSAPHGVLLVNVGSPDAPTTAAVRRYLREFLGDPDVVKLNRAAWWLVLNGVVLPLRSPKSARLYQSIWTERGSPLIDNSVQQRERLASELGAGFRVALAMRYGNPSLARGMDELASAGCRRVVLVPMFPQFSRATTGSVEKAVHAECSRLGERPDLVVLPPWFDDDGYIAALAASVSQARAKAEFDHLLISFHGLPASSVAEGDPYRDQCVATAGALARKLGLSDSAWTLAFQSRFGRKRWLEPYATDVVRALAPAHPRVLVICPGFVADCLETLEELHLRLAQDFRAAGGAELAVVPCLNAGAGWIATLARLVRRHAQPHGIEADG